MIESVSTPRSAATRPLVWICIWASIMVAAFAPQPAAAAAGWNWPVDGELLTPYRNVDNPYASGQHRGIDIAAAVGASVRAASTGTVSFSGRLPDSGVGVTVRTADGKYLVSYLHLQATAVTRGERVSTGQEIGRVGMTGKRSITAPHLHFGVRLASNGSYLDPLSLLGPSVQTNRAPESIRPDVAEPLAALPPAAAMPDSRPIERRQRVTTDQRRSDENARSRGETRTDAHSQTKSHRSKSQSDSADRITQHGNGLDAHTNSWGNRSARSRARASRSRGERSINAPRPMNRLLLSKSDFDSQGQSGAAADRASATTSTRSGNRRGPQALSLLAVLVACAAGMILWRRRRQRATVEPTGTAPNSAQPLSRSDDTELFAPLANRPEDDEHSALRLVRGAQS